jgi:apolipoprotein N-acyltransferase
VIDRFADHRLARLLLALIAGLAVALSFPAASWWPLAFVGVAPLIIGVVRAPRGTEAFLLGWIALTVAWLVNLPWVVDVMVRFGGIEAIVGYALYIALAAVLGLYGGLFAWGVFRLRLGTPFLPWMAVPLMWAATEYARSYILSGFPWHLLGTAMIDFRPYAQLSAIAGPYALGALLVLFSTMIAWLATAAGDRSSRLRVAGAGAGLFLLSLLIGVFMMISRERSIAQATLHRVGLVQPNISQEMRWNEQELISIWERMMRLTWQAIDDGAVTILWPESTVPLAFMDDRFPYQESLEAVTARSGTDLILGSIAEDAIDPMKIWNAAYLVSSGSTAGRYDKMRLVPFGEYVPLRRLLFFAEKLVRQVGEFQFGTSEVPLAGRFQYGPAICYEVVYPRLVGRQVANGADVLVTITNDAWFGESAAPVQHLNSARMRAVENDRWLLRAATTGISALVDPTGRIVASLPMNEEGVVSGGFSSRSSITPYVRFGDWFAMVAIIASIAAVIARRRRKDHERGSAR